MSQIFLVNRHAVYFPLPSNAVKQNFRSGAGNTRVFPGYHRVVTVDPYRLVVVRDGEGEDLPVDLILALDSAEELDDASHRKGILWAFCGSAMSSAAAPHFISQVRNGKNMSYMAMKKRRAGRCSLIYTTGKWLPLDISNCRVYETQFDTQERALDDLGASLSTRHAESQANNDGTATDGDSNVYLTASLQDVCQRTLSAIYVPQMGQKFGAIKTDNGSIAMHGKVGFAQQAWTSRPAA